MRSFSANHLCHHSSVLLQRFRGRYNGWYFLGVKMKCCCVATDLPLLSCELFLSIMVQFKDFQVFSSLFGENLETSVAESLFILWGGGSV